MKNIFYNSYIQYKNGTHKLKELTIGVGEQEKQEEIPITEVIPQEEIKAL